MDKTIVIVTPNRDTFSNPTIIEFIKKCSERNKVVLLSPVKTNGMELNIEEQFIPYPFLDFPRSFSDFNKIIRSHLRVWKLLFTRKVTDIIAIDPMGLVICGRLKRIMWQMRIHYISFEIFFKDELEQFPKFSKIKQKELAYSKRITSIVIQDDVRKKLLSEENCIDNDVKWFQIPVSPVKTLPRRNTPVEFVKGKKTIVHSGTVDYWSGMQIIIDCLKQGIPEDYVFVIHSRFPLNADNPLHAELMELERSGFPIILHDKVFDDYDEYYGFLRSFNYGIALYLKQGDNPYAGKNVENIGLSSGKFATYMMLGIPTITSSSGIFAVLNRQYNFGKSISSATELAVVLRGGALELLKKENCRKLYNEVLNPEEPLNDYVEYLSNLN